MYNIYVITGKITCLLLYLVEKIFLNNVSDHKTINNTCLLSKYKNLQRRNKNLKFYHTDIATSNYVFIIF